MKAVTVAALVLLANTTPVSAATGFSDVCTLFPSLPDCQVIVPNGPGGGGTGGEDPPPEPVSKGG